MIKVLYLVRRADGLTHDEFLRYQLEHHAPLALAHHPRMLRYVTNPVVQDSRSPEDIDTVAELWFASPEDLHRDRFYDSPQGREIIRSDVRNFCSPGTRRYITQEIVMKSHVETSAVYRPGQPVEALGGAVLPGAGWRS